MTERVLGPTGSRSRTTRASLLLMALIGVVFGVLISGGTFATAAKPGPGVVDYAQCADGKLVENVPEANDCPKGWINGILNENNSSYHEDQVTPQRLIVDFTSGGEHTIDLSWLVRKGDAHAYDSLATWNHTQTGALPCQGLTGATGTACTTAIANGAVSGAIPGDNLEVDSNCTTGSLVTADHQLQGQELKMFGLGALGEVDPLEYNGVSSDSEGLFQHGTVTFRFAAGATAPFRAYLYFGGHLARGSGSTGWGEDCGASSISGGPYHIKVDAIDDASAGSRDNQIMSGAILPLADATITSDASGTPTTTWSASISDSATVTGDNTTGSVIFRLYAPGDTTCTTPIAAATETVALVSGSATSTAFTDIGSGKTYGAGTYQYTVEYLGDPQNNPTAELGCGDTSEQVTVAAATDATVS